MVLLYVLGFHVVMDICPQKNSFLLQVLLQVKHIQMKLHNTNCVMKLVLTKIFNVIVLGWPCQRSCGVQPLTSTHVNTVHWEIYCVTYGEMVAVFFNVNQCVSTVYDKQK